MGFEKIQKSRNQGAILLNDKKRLLQSLQLSTWSGKLSIMEKLIMTFLHQKNYSKKVANIKKHLKCYWLSGFKFAICGVLRNNPNGYRSNYVFCICHEIFPKMLQISKITSYYMNFGSFHLQPLTSFGSF